MKKILVTGSIGVGKSTVCRYFQELGISVYYSDIQAKKIMDRNSIVIIKLKDLFGEEIYKDGVLDRKAVADIVFNDKEKLEQLNAIAHPAVSEHFKIWCKSEEIFNDSPYVIEEAAIAIDLGIQGKFDYIIVVTADEEVRINRTMNRDNCTREKVLSIINSQTSEEEKLKHADYVIVNNDSENLDSIEDQVKLIHQQILERIKNKSFL